METVTIAFILLVSYGAVQVLQAAICPRTFTMQHDQSEGISTGCQHLGGGGGLTLEECMTETCKQGGNAFNYKDNTCYYKRCIGSDLKTNPGHGGWNIYTMDPLDRCPRPFSKVKDRSENIATGCEHLGGGEGYDLESCKKVTCNEGGNAFNFKDDTCYYKRCKGSDLKPYSGDGGWDIYTMDPLDYCPRPFSKVHDRSENIATGCLHLGGGDGFTLESCKTQTCNEGGNAFNFKDGTCYYKRCADSELHPSSDHGGWDIYAVDPLVTCKGSKVQISCVGDFVIHIMYAIYGRYDTTTCASSDASKNENTDCIKDAKDTLASICDGQDSCEKRVNNNNFGKACSGTEHYLTYQYECVYTRTCSMTFAKLHDESEGISTGCQHLGGGPGYDLEGCKEETCLQGGNAFNFKGNTCYFKNCDSADLHTNSDHDGWNIYRINQVEYCYVPFYKAHDESEGISTGCDHLGGGSGYDLESCKRATCEVGGNGFNYKDDTCYYKRCKGSDLKTNSGHGGWNIYTMNLT